MSDTTPAPPTDLPSPPFISIPGIANFRDIGDYPAHLPDGTFSSPSSIRRHVLFRCADPSKVEPEGLAKLKELGVKKVFDLRSTPEIQRQGPEWKGVEVDAATAFYTRGEGEQEQGDRIERVWCPVFAGEDYGPEKVALRYKAYASSGSEGFVQAYKDIMTNGPKAYNTILSHLAAEKAEPCIVHCTAGKDRTGVIVALVFLLCGVDKQIIAEEYALTDLGLAHMKPLFMKRLLANPALEGNEQGVRNMISSRKENMLATIGMIEERFGGAEKYVRDVVGLSEEQVSRLRRNLVVEEKAILPHN